MLNLNKAKQQFKALLSKQDAEAIRAWKARNEERKAKAKLLKENIIESYTLSANSENNSNP